MEETSWKIDNLELASTKLTEELRFGSLTLDITSKKFICKYCESDVIGDYCCGYYKTTTTELEIKTTFKHKSNLITDLRKALFNEGLSDFTFIIDKERIPVSKIILAARSPVFERLFNADFTEKNQNQQTLKSTIPKAAFKELIRYIYTDEVCELSKHVFDLLHASDYYQVESLKSICEEEMHKILCVRNANKIFQSAHLYQCTFALKEASYAVIKNIFESINYNLPEEFRNNPSKVAKLFEIKDLLEDELRPTIKEE